METIRPVILSGGSGTRLWPLSTEDRPKQLLALTGDKTMLQLTVRRTFGRPGFEAPLIVANARHEAEIRSQLSGIGVERFELVLEPSARNTAAAIGLAALRAAPGELLLVMPSDHVIKDEEAFRAAVTAAADAAREGWLLTFGIRPSGPETGYGYIRRGAALAPAVHEVARFVEKPDLATAEHYVASGDYAWNGGIFLFRSSDYLSALGTHAPDVLAACEAAVADGRHEGAAFLPDAQAFARSPSISIDYAVMEKHDRVAVASVDMGWSDIGSWDSLYDYLSEGADRAAGDPNILQIGCKGTLVRTDGPVVGTLGLDDVIVIATGDAVLVMRRGESQNVRQLIERIRAGERSVAVT